MNFFCFFSNFTVAMYLLNFQVYVKGFHGDLSETFLLGDVDDGGKRLVSVTKNCLYAAINVCKHNERFSLIGKTIRYL